MTDQFTSPIPNEQPVNPMPEETQADLSKTPESDSHELPGLRPLDSDLIKHEHHEKKPDLSVKPPPVTESPSDIQADLSQPSNFVSLPPPPLPPAPPVSAPEQPPPPVIPPPGPATPSPAPEMTPPPQEVPPPAVAVPVVPPPAVPSPSSSSVQMDSANQMLQPMEPNIPMVPMPQPQFFASNLVPLTSVPLPMFMPGTTQTKYNLTSFISEKFIICDRKILTTISTF